ncbi:uncharacterized protein LOC123702298 [Colias croceus]|uniref:uncharacterized protein LOC123702298 n=1 Tax=Colias crocea TaxID=72248 RepID=UPI001E27CBF8|nr:uncharacterized protein LOC123702298 [Colias croceus]
MKKTVKDKVAGHRKHAMGTGGGPPLPDLKMEPWEEEILMHIKLTAVGLPPVFDDDNQDEIQVIEVGGFDPLIEAVAVEPSDTDTDTLKVNDSLQTGETQADHPRKDITFTKNWATYTPAMLRSPLTERLQDKQATTEVRRARKRTYTGTTTNKTWTELGEVKTKVAHLKAKKLENDIKLQDVLLEEGKLRCEKIKLEIELLKLQLINKSSQ